MLALFALALQLVVSFGHVHADELTGQPLDIASTEHAGEAQAAAGDTDTDHHDDHCDICATLYALASAQIAAPPLLPLPRAFGPVEQPIRAHATAANSHRAQFQSRAPPAA